MNAIFGFLAKIIGYPMTWIYQLTGNYALSIVLITVLIRAILIPLYFKQIDQQSKMAELQAQVDDIRVRYARDQQKMNEKINELYSSQGVSTMSGCLPTLIQLPIILGLYQLLRSPLEYMTAPEMLAAVHESFLWVPDLSQPDAWILPILAGLTTYFSTVLSTKGQDAAAAGAMKSMTYFSPLMIFLFGRSFAAGLTLYWFVGNLFLMVQTMLINKKKEKAKLKKQAQLEIEKRKKAEK